LSHTNPFHNTPSHLCKIHLNIIHPPTSCLPNGSFPLVFLLQPICIPLLANSSYMSCPSHPPWLDYSNYTWQRVVITKLLVMQFSPPSVTSALFSPNIHLSTLFSNTLSLCRTTGKNTVLYILILKFFDSRREDRRFWTEW
jgi:hypothetical protein